VAPTAPPASDPEPAPTSETSFSDLRLEVEKLNQELPAEEPAVEPDDDGCFTLDTDDGVSLDDLVAEAAGQAESSATEGPEAGDGGLFGGAGEDPARSGDVDLLAEILAEDSEVAGVGEAEQLATITREIGAQVGGQEGEEDADRLYEMGLVYLEMGLFDQACASLEKAAADPAFAVRAHEMWGIALSRANRPDEAVDTLTAGLEQAQPGTQEYLGLLYHIGRAHEQAGRADEALAFFMKIQEQDRSYLDVGKRVAELTTI
jgi:tetratricopeptide (TPR) repeat protein